MYSDAHNELLVVPTEYTGSHASRFELTEEGPNHVPLTDPKTLSMQTIDTFLLINWQEHLISSITNAVNTESQCWNTDSHTQSIALCVQLWIISD